MKMFTNSHHFISIWTSLLVMELVYLSSGVESQMSDAFFKTCSVNEFACGGRRGGGGGGMPSCISKFKTCDGQRDCTDGSDEMHELCQKDLYQLTSDRPLSLPPNSVAGTILMRHNNTWRTLCSFSFDNIKAQIVCRNLGYRDGISAPLYGAYFGENTLYESHDNFGYSCVGHESTLSECPGFDWEDSYIPCNHNADSGVFCLPGKLDVNLVGGRTRSSGLLQIKSSSLSSPAAVCGEGFDDLDAQVVCRMLGYNANQAVAHPGPSFGMGSGTIWNIILNCDGTEKSLEECGYRISDTQCTHLNAAALTCTRDTTVDSLLDFVLPSDCGEAVDSSGRFISALGKISGGQVHSRFDVPWLAALRLTFGGDQFHSCGASIISEYYLLTAAHCFDTVSKLSYVVSVGNFNNDYVDQTQQDYVVDKVWIHENYKPRALDNDIAMIKVKTINNRGIKFGERVRPVCLPKTGESYGNLNSCTVSGWGQIVDGGNSTTLPRTVGFDALPDATCERLYGSDRITSSFSCFGRNRLTGACRGDSGSPVTCIGSNGRHVLYGIHSGGAPCILFRLTAKFAARVTKHLRWIQETITRDLNIRV